MSKEAFAPICHAERVQNVDWASFICDRLQLAEPRDKRRSPSVTKVAPYLQAISSHVLQVPLTPPLPSFVKSPDVQSISEAKRRKLDWETPFGDKSKATMGQGIKPERLRGADSGYTGYQDHTFSQTPSAKLQGVFSLQDAVQSLSDLNRFICNQDAMVLTLETQKAEGERIDSLEREVSHLQSRVDEVLKEKTALQEELAQISADMRNRMADMVGTVQEIQLLTPLVDLEKATLDGQGVTGVSFADADVDTLKKEVFDYTKELWHQATALFQEHMAKPIDQYKSWFESTWEYKVREENAELRAHNADLEMQLEAIRKQLMAQQSEVKLGAQVTVWRDKGKDKLPVEESSSSTRRHSRETAAADTQFMASARTAARTARAPPLSMTAEEQEENDLFTAQLMSMMGTFEQLAKNPRMQKLLKTKDYRTGSQAETSQQATSRQRQVTEPVERVPTVATGPVQHVTQAQDPARNDVVLESLNCFLGLETVLPQKALVKALVALDGELFVYSEEVCQSPFSTGPSLEED
ncbi:hypothetical protein L7F22_028021 [Adiantum nelumboides]|nr:hypothetical protein [Adiantum nelumboides]